ncbi:MAG: biopolymer transporter ExbD [Thermoanaerobaculia bacterium]
MRHALRAEINVTPLVDVCLVLLIIFMVVTPLLNGVKLPEAPQPEAWPAEPARTRITLVFGPPVAISIDDDPSPLSEPAFEELLKALHAQRPGRQILLRADRRLSYGEVKRVMRAVQAAGFPAIGLVAEKPAGVRP